MAIGTYVSYLRVSTARQGLSGLGIEAQRKAVMDYLNGGHWTLIAEYVEVESGANDARPKLAEALARCRLHNATLVIAKLDRLSRDAHFLLGLEKAGVKFVAADMPQANETMVGMMAVIAQAERKMIGDRTKAALAAAKARGVKLGGDRGNLPKVAHIGREVSLEVRRKAAEQRQHDVAPIVAQMRAEARQGCAEGATSLSPELSLRQIAAGLNERGVPAPRGGRWSAAQVMKLRVD
jgi:DNA invertase Pin-like site-specific DNA recombinase